MAPLTALVIAFLLAVLVWLLGNLPAPSAIRQAVTITAIIVVLILLLVVVGILHLGRVA